MHSMTSSSTIKRPIDPNYYLSMYLMTNIEGARESGMQAVKFENAVQVKSGYLEKL